MRKSGGIFLFYNKLVAICIATTLATMGCVGCAGAPSVSSASDDSSSVSGELNAPARSDSSSSSSAVSVLGANWTKNSDANKFISGYNNAYPENPIVESDVEAYTNGAGNAALVTIGDIVCQFTFSDGNPTLSILSDLPLDAAGRALYLEQAAKAVSVKYGMTLEEARNIMAAFDDGRAKQLGEGREYKTFDSNGVGFLLKTEDIHHNYDLFIMKNRI